MKERIGYFDSAKAILITMVVVGHILNYANPDYSILPYTLAQSFITSFHMSAFFVISGILVDTEKWRERPCVDYIVRRIKSLIIPYFFFETIAILYKSFVLKSVSPIEGLKNAVTLKCNVGADWFLPAMFFASILFLGYIKLHKKTIWAAVAGTAMLLLYFMPVGHWQSVLFQTALGFSFMVFGKILKRHLTSFTHLKVIAAFVMTAVCAAISLEFSINNDYYSGILQCPPLCFVSGVCGTYFVLGIARYIQFKWVRFIGENSLVIMGTHQLVLYTVPHNSSFVWIIGVFVLIAVIEVVIILITNKLCPFLIGKSKKKST